MYHVPDGVEHLDAIVATHPDADHIGGLSAALNAVSCDVCYCSTKTSDTETFADMVRYVNEQGIGITVPHIPTSFQLGAATVTIVVPVRDFGSGSEGENDNSLVCRVEYGASSFLFMGDATERSERALMQAGVELQAELLKIAHHGSKHSTSIEFLKAVDPTYAIISVGADNTYSHPDPELLGRLDSVGLEYWRTDQSGDIVATSFGDVIDVSPTKEKVDVQEAPDGQANAEAKAASGEGAALAGAVDAADTQSQMPEGTTYILNTNSKKMHVPDCASARTIKDKNKAYFSGSLEELRAQYPEYDACGNCKPW